MVPGSRREAFLGVEGRGHAYYSHGALSTSWFPSPSLSSSYTFWSVLEVALAVQRTAHVCFPSAMFGSYPLRSLPLARMNVFTVNVSKYPLQGTFNSVFPRGRMSTPSMPLTSIWTSSPLAQGLSCRL